MSTTMRHAAETTASAISDLVGEAQDRLDDLSLPSIHGHSLSDLHLPRRQSKCDWGRLGSWALVIAIIVGTVVIVRRLTSSNDEAPSHNT